MDQNEQSSRGAAKKRNKQKGKKAEEEIDEDALLDQLINENRSIAATTSNINDDETTTPVLKVDCRQLDPEVEIKSLLEKNMSMCGSKKIVRQQRNVRTIGRVIKMKTGWPPIKNTGNFLTNQIYKHLNCLGLSMNVFKVNNGITYFRIQHGEAYQSQQYLFTTLRKSHDIEAIMASQTNWSKANQPIILFRKSY